MGGPGHHAGAVATHEACHAAHVQRGITLPDAPTWEADYDRYKDGAVRYEAFAATCEVGPLATQLVGDACADDPPGTEAFPYIRDTVYVTPVVDDPPGLLPEEVGRAAIPGNDAGFEVA